jgi:AcrR family transcriptional regulator
MTDTSAGASRTARDRARAELTREIKEEARRQLAATGADGLSLRAVARQLGMVSSALYRYYPSRDELLTALIIDAYDVMGEAAERAIARAAPRSSARGRWIAACHAVRAWAKSNPHEYALIYGSPVPGYRAPRDTVVPAARVPIAFVGVLRDAIATGELAPDDDGKSLDGPDGPLTGQATALAAALAEEHQAAALAVPPEILVRSVIAWTQLFGMISFELFGQFVGSFEPADALFAHATARLATFVGLPVSLRVNRAKCISCMKTSQAVAPSHPSGDPMPRATAPERSVCRFVPGACTQVLASCR